MNKSLYYIECTCIKDVKYPGVEFHVGDVLWYNPNAIGREMCIYFNYKEKKHTPDEEVKEIYKKWGHRSYLPLTRTKEYAKKWKVKRAADSSCYYIDREIFSPVVKEIKITYTVEE